MNNTINQALNNINNATNNANATQNNVEETKNMTNTNNALSNKALKTAVSSSIKYRNIAGKKYNAKDLPVNVTKKAKDLFNNSTCGKLWAQFCDNADAYDKEPNNKANRENKKEKRVVRDQAGADYNKSLNDFNFGETAEKMIVTILDTEVTASDKEKVQNVNTFLTEIGLTTDSAQALGKMTAIIYSMITRVNVTPLDARKGNFSTKQGGTFKKQLVTMLVTLVDKENCKARQQAEEAKQKAKQQEAEEKAKKKAEREAKKDEKEAENARKQAEKASKKNTKAPKTTNKTAKQANKQ